MTRDEELWACALQVMKVHGDGVGDYIVERITALEQAGDTDGVDT